MKTEGKHTAGPWYLKGSSIKARWEDGEEVQVALLSTTTFCGGTKESLAGNRRMSQESEANGSLIAAAPELLEKCTKIHAWLLRLAKKSESQARNCNFETLREACEADARNYRTTARDLEQVIAKAAGGSEPTE